jgi:hypothetical protein
MLSIFTANNVDLSNNSTATITSSSRSTRFLSSEDPNSSNNNNSVLNNSIESLKTKLGKLETNIAQLTATISNKPDESNLLSQISKLIDSKFLLHSSTPLSTSISSNNNSPSEEQVPRPKPGKVSWVPDRQLIFKLYEKKIKSENHISLIETLNNNNKVLPELRHNNFPIPFLPDDQEFLNDYNDLITSFQTSITGLIHKHMSARIDQSEKRLQLAINGNKDLQTLAQQIEQDVYDSYSHKRLSSHNKISNIIKSQAPDRYELKQRHSNQSNSREYSPATSPPNYFGYNSTYPSNAHPNREKQQNLQQPRSSHRYHPRDNNKLNRNNFNNDNNKPTNNNMNCQQELIDLTRADSGYSGSYNNNSSARPNTSEHSNINNNINNNNNFNKNKNFNNQNGQYKSPYNKHHSGYSHRVFINSNSNSYKRSFDTSDQDRPNKQQPFKKSRPEHQYQ